MALQEPKYKEVYNWIAEGIRSGQLQPGARLPSEHELVQQFGLSRQTVRHAIDLLAQQQLVKRVRGSGTYVEGAGTDRAGTAGAGTEPDRVRYKNIAVVSTYVDSYIFPAVLRGIEGVLSEEGYTTQIAFTGNKVMREQEILQRLLDKDMIDGLIVEPAKSSLPGPTSELCRRLTERRIPVLCFNCSYPDLELPCVSLDDEEVGRRAAAYLVKAGHRRIGGIFKCDDGQGRLRYKGYVRGLEEAGIRLRDEQVVWMDTEAMLEMEAWSDYLFRRIQGCTALVCYNDETACILSGLCEKRGIRIPEDLSLIGVDNSELAALADVPLTSIPHPAEALGRKAACQMIRMIEEPGYDGNYRFISDVVERESVKKL